LEGHTTKRLISNKKRYSGAAHRLRLFSRADANLLSHQLKATQNLDDIFAIGAAEIVIDMLTRSRRAIIRPRIEVFMTWRSRIIALVAIAIGACSDHSHAGALSIPHPDSSSARVEYFIKQPQGSGPWPTVVVLHGHQNIWSRPGGLQFVQWGVLDKFAARGYLAVSVSLPGFGNSDGPRDFAGPNTQHAVSAVIAKLKQDGLAKDDKILIQGISLGAVTAALIATQDPTIAGMVLISGLYDLTEFLKQPTSLQTLLVKYALFSETDGSAQALRARSALNFTESIKAAALILNGAKDDRTDPDQAILLAERIKSQGARATAHVFSDYGHEIPVSVRDPEIDAFITEVLAP